MHGVRDAQGVQPIGDVVKGGDFIIRGRFAHQRREALDQRPGLLRRQGVEQRRFQLGLLGFVQCLHIGIFLLVVCAAVSVIAAPGPRAKSTGRFYRSPAEMYMA